MVNYFHPRSSFNAENAAIAANGNPEEAGKPICSEAFLQLLMFVDKRPGSHEQIRLLRKSLETLKTDFAFDLQIIDVGEQPYLAEHFKLMATPCLLKIHPSPRQMLAGSDLIAQLEYWWVRWQLSLEELWNKEQSQLANHEIAAPISIHSITSAAELIKLTDEVFRLKQEKEHLQEQLKLKDRIIAMLAHDLRNPLTSVSLALETLEATDKQKDNLLLGETSSLKENIVKQARRQIRIIDRMIADILQAARGTNAQFHIQPQKLELKPICDDVLVQLEDRFQAKSLHVETDIPVDLPCVYADPERLLQVMMNLLDNAVKYTPEKGSITISILHRTAHKVQVSICDNGLGIPEENYQKIFEDRFRLERDELKDGYGIGLALCQRIIRAHYGQIWVDSAEQSGSCFHFTLPVYK
ncbi:histidine kinase [Oscillatoriales cyanobacterium USR001]|nr:histidine kinase [Oscillatoriales cyanobacterium USR001]